MNSKNKKVLAGSMLTLSATGMTVTPATADESAQGHYSQNIEIIRDFCPTIQDVDVLSIEVLDESRVFQCDVLRQSYVKGESSAPAFPILSPVHN
jgi:hypothetical protein